MKPVLFAWTLGLAVLPVLAENVDPDDSGLQYAWSENAGWINAEPGGNGGPGMQAADFALTGWMWAENAGWISLSCENTSSCGTTAYGVQNDGHGRLRGEAWGENVGWIRFSTSWGGSVGVDPVSGKLAGRAWAENLGWIDLGGIKTAWCHDTSGVPTGGPDLRASRSGSDVLLGQLVPGGGAAWHELVRGKLSALRSTGGDFTAAMLDCVGDDVTADSHLAQGTPEPVPGDGYWYLARGVNCKGKGTFDAGIGQVGSRDQEILASGAACP
jgi:hypothetical protein